MSRDAELRTARRGIELKPSPELALLRLVRGLGTGLRLNAFIVAADQVSGAGLGKGTPGGGRGWPLPIGWLAERGRRLGVEFCACLRTLVRVWRREKSTQAFFVELLLPTVAYREANRIR